MHSGNLQQALDSDLLFSWSDHWSKQALAHCFHDEMKCENTAQSNEEFENKTDWLEITNASGLKDVVACQAYLLSLSEPKQQGQSRKQWEGGKSCIPSFWINLMGYDIIFFFFFNEPKQ